MATTFTPTPTFSGLALAGFFTGSSSATDAVQADVGYVLSGPGQPGLITANATPNMSVKLNAFTALIAGASPATSGPQLWTSGTAQLSITLDAADLTNPRYDRITLQITQQPDGSTTPPTPGLGNIVVVPGTPSASPVEPLIPAGSLDLGRILVPSGAGATITSGAILSRVNLGGLRGATVRGYAGAFGRITRPGQLYWDEVTGRLSVTDSTNALESIAGVGTNWPEWFLRGVPASFSLVSGGSFGTAMGFSTADKNVGVSIASQTTGAVVTATDAGSYFASAGLRVTQNGTGTGERDVFIEHQTSAGVRIRRAESACQNVSGAPTYGSVARRFRMAAGEKLVAGYYQNTGTAQTPLDTFGDWVFEGYKVMDL